MGVLAQYLTDFYGFLTTFEFDALRLLVAASVLWTLGDIARCEVTTCLRWPVGNLLM